ncbi:hypothetical protein [Moorena sp. SIO3I8]|nr:hypothetical protein [Moorena sp. SIO3I8]
MKAIGQGMGNRESGPTPNGVGSDSRFPNTLTAPMPQTLNVFM